MICLPGPLPRSDSSTTTFSITAYGEADLVMFGDDIQVRRGDHDPVELENEQMQTRGTQDLLEGRSIPAVLQLRVSWVQLPIQAEDVVELVCPCLTKDGVKVAVIRDSNPQEEGRRPNQQVAGCRPHRGGRRRVPRP